MKKLEDNTRYNKDRVKVRSQFQSNIHTYVVDQNNVIIRFKIYFKNVFAYFAKMLEFCKSLINKIK